MENAAREVVEEVGIKRADLQKRPIKWKIVIGSIVVAGALVLTGISYYQTTRFNSHITINGTNVGGMTANQALQKLGSSVLKNEVYVGQEKIFDGKDSKLGFTNNDLSSVKILLKSQKTFWPSSKARNYSLTPSKLDPNISETMKNEIEKKLLLMNKSLKAPQDADAHLEQGKMVVSKSITGNQYDVPKIVIDYQKQEYKSVIHLNAEYIQPAKENSPIVQKEEKTLQELLQRTVSYTVQSQVYSLKASDLIKNASLSKDGQFIIDPSDIKNEIAKINTSQSTLNKNFQFKTHLGTVISVKGQTYGWALDASKETNRIQEAFEKGENSVIASNVYGNGWDKAAIGFNNTTNNGIGDSYAEVSIQEQRIWIYKNGQLVLTTNVVTGRHDVGEDTHTGVWYILYKRSPAILVGSEVGMANYRVPVNYWAPFTNDGEGFHDASWRKNWANTAYLTQGSGGCVNTPPSVMKSVYDNLSTFEPVVVY
ncbi:L,D-transpeptidase [Neobacillus pocheonensis]|uniref:L,D-transpeptidase n=1 Tax=Neobacillus pocheonensis TaxID=363869 RepID=A0ABT0WBS4_9BACI|nr:L,D-transpeptidase [Neobacillus pocheonensis]